MALSVISNSAIVNGIAASGTNAGRPCVFEYLSELYYIEGSSLAYIWDSENEIWNRNAPMETYNISPGLQTGSTVFLIGSDLYMIKGKSTSTLLGYKWSDENQQWEQNSGIISGIDLSGSSYLDPNAIFYNSELYLIVGDETGNYHAYKWTGANWATNTFIINGLSSTKIYIRPAFFYIGTSLYCISYPTSGNIHKWNADLNIWEEFVITGLPGGGSPCYHVFPYNGSIYLMWGISNLAPYGYKFDVSAFESFFHVRGENNQLTLIATTTSETPVNDEVRCYYSTEEEGLISSQNRVILSTSDNISFSTVFPKADAITFFAAVEYYKNGMLTQTLSISDYYTKVDQKEITLINITNPDNYVILDNPLHDYNHGFIFHDGYLYGSARNKKSASPLESSVFKINAADYSILSQQKIFQNKNGETLQLYGFDQIVECLGFLWVSTGTYLVRINPADLDYMVFSGMPALFFSAPIGTDGTHLYHAGEDYLYKLDTSLLVDSFAVYGYTGDSAISLPANTIIDQCSIIQYHPTNKAGVHSFVCDASFIYIAVTSSAGAFYDGFADGIYFFHMQKIDKNTMQTVGDVIIPKTTDDMVQSPEYVFLAPENSADYPVGSFGYDWGFLAIKKTTLEIRFLKALHDGQANVSPVYRSCYGAFYFNEKIVVQQTRGDTVVIDLSNIEEWGEFFPIGGATESIFDYQLNGATIVDPCNELVLDDNGFVHTNTWGDNTIVFKFTLDTITAAEPEPIIQTTLISSTDAEATVQGYIIDSGQSAITQVGFRYSTDPNNLNINVPATLGTTFTETLNSLTAGVYYIQAWATNTEGTFYGNTVVFSTYNVLTLAYNTDDAVLDYINKLFGCSIRCVQDAPGVADGTTGTATDNDGNVYQTIVINEKRWFCSNLKTKKFRNGEAIPEVIPAASWAALNSAGRCKYE
nr:hypothetical protein [uncultured Draconibacterium sp.]